MAKQYDVIVIGSGGGMKIALPAANMGLKTALIEQDAVAGTCLNRGCIPSKMLIYPSELPHLLTEAQQINVHSESSPTIDFPNLIKRISETVDAMSDSQRKALLGTPNLDFIPEHAEFLSDRIIQAGQHQITAPKVFIATGSKPFIPNISGLKNTPYMTSREALRRTDLPKRLLVIGASYIAVEIGGAYAAAGAQVDFIVRSRFLRQEDREISQVFARQFSKNHTVYQGMIPEKVTFSEGRFTVSSPDKTLQGDALLIATGTVPCTEDLGLSNTGIHITNKGFIEVNDHLETSVKGVHALGDCIGRYLFRHTVNYEGEYLVRTALKNGPTQALDYGPVPHAIFTNPEIAGVGLTEEQAQGMDYVVGKADYSNSNAGLARGYGHGFAKLIIDRVTGKILGAHILGPEASNMIHLFIVALKTGATIDDLADMIFIHPALPEIARDAIRDAKRQL